MTILENTLLPKKYIKKCKLRVKIYLVFISKTPKQVSVGCSVLSYLSGPLYVHDH